MQIAILLVGLAFLLTLVIVANTKNQEKAKGNWYGWYEHTDPYWENATASPSAEPTHTAGDDTC